MKKAPIMIGLLIPGVFVILVSLCVGDQIDIPPETPTIYVQPDGEGLVIKKNIDPDLARKIIGKISKRTVLDLKNKNFKDLAVLTHPKKGVLIGDVILNPDEVRNVMGSEEKRFHVILGGEGDDAYFAFGDFYRKYIYDSDYANAPEINYDKYHFLFAANECWLYKAYPNSIVVQYYFPDSFPVKGNARKSLAIVFEKADGSKWYIVAIAHDEWSP